MLFAGNNKIEKSYGCYGYTRGNGKVFHAGQDISTDDNDTIFMPSYKGRPIRGKVVTSRIVKDRKNPTWEWGHYVCVQLDKNQTPDTVNFLYFCHNAKNIVKVGDKVKTGDPIALMGNTGNAENGYKHVHFEARATKTGRPVSPENYTGMENKVSVKTLTQTEYYLYPLFTLKVRPYPVADDNNMNKAIEMVEKGKKYSIIQTRNGWAFIRATQNITGWVCFREEKNGSINYLAEIK